jgi:ABC-2 type transport system ATP-binding protein
MVLKVEELRKSFGNKEVLKGISFETKSGTSLGLLGRNGSGKTTTIRIIMNIFKADSGKATIDGVSSAKFVNKIGYLPEERGLYAKRLISEQLGYLGELKGLKFKDAQSRGLKLLKKLDAEEFYNKKLNTLSKGNQQKVQLAVALINDPEIVILDELFSGLDPVNSLILKELVSEIASQGRIIFFSSHQMGQVEGFCNDICIINKGEIVLSGNLKQIKKSYPRDKVIITTEDGDAGALFNKLTSLGINSSNITKTYDGCCVKLTSGLDKAKLFADVSASGADISSFSIKEPTLEEIFIEKAGENDESN